MAMARTNSNSNSDSSACRAHSTRCCLVHVLLAIKECTPTVDLLVAAAEANSVSLLDRLIAQGVDPSADENRALRVAAACGHASVVDRLLSDTRVDAAADNDAALRCAAQCGHAAVVDRLMRDARVNASTDDSVAVSLAIDGNHCDTVARLLRDARVVLSATHLTAAMASAGHRGDVRVVDLLLRDGRAEPLLDFNRALHFALTRRYIDVVDRLLCDVRVLDAADAGSFACLTHIRMIRSRATAACVGLQSLGLPALVTLKIVNALIPNAIRMAAKWDLIVAVKHFHDRRPVRLRVNAM